MPMKIVLILIALLFGACSEKVRTVKFITLHQGESVKEVIELNDGHCPKVGDHGHFPHRKFKHHEKIYAVNCISDSNPIYYFKTIQLKSNNEIQIDYYKNYYGTVYLIRSTKFRVKILKPFNGSYLEYLNRNPDYNNYFVDYAGKTSQSNFSSILKDITYHYKFEKSKEVNIKYNREINKNDKTYKKYYMLEGYTKKKQKSLILKKHRDFNHIKNLFVRIDEYQEKWINTYKEAYKFEKKLNIDIDFNIPYLLEENDYGR